MKAEELIIGAWYIFRADVKMNMAPGLPLRYTGIQEYQNEKHYDFWEPRWMLHHWLNPQDLEPYIEKEN